MTKAQALQDFLETIIPNVYPSQNAPETVDMPFMTYEMGFGAINDGEVAIEADMWFYTESEAVPNAKVQELSEKIGLGGKILPYDNGAIWLKRGSPYCNALTDTNDTKIKRRVINLSAEFLSAD